MFIACIDHLKMWDMCLGLFTSVKTQPLFVVFSIPRLPFHCCWSVVQCWCWAKWYFEQRFAIPREDVGYAQRSESRERCFHADPTLSCQSNSMVIARFSCTRMDLVTRVLYSIWLQIGSRNNQSSLDITIHVHTDTHQSLSLSIARGVSDRWTQVKLGSYFEHQNVPVVVIMASFLVWRWVRMIPRLSLCLSWWQRSF